MLIKRPLLALTIFLIFAITVSAASAACSGCYKSCNSCSGSCSGYSSSKMNSCSSGNCAYSGNYGSYRSGGCGYPGNGCKSCAGCNGYGNCKNGQCGYTKNGNCANCSGCQGCRGCRGGNCSTGTGTTTPPIVPTDATGTTKVNLCSNGVCNVGGSGQILVLTNYNNATDVTYQQLLDFLRADKTDEHPYTRTYVCSDFSKALHDSAEAHGIRAGWVGVKSCNHAFNVFNTTDRGLIYIDDTGVPGGSTYQDKLVNCVSGQPLTETYLFRTAGTMKWGCVVQNIQTFW